MYEEWRARDYSRPLFQRLDTVALSLLRKILSPAVSKRATVAQIRQHLWCRKSFTDKGENVQSALASLFCVICGLVDSFLPRLKMKKSTMVMFARSLRYYCDSGAWRERALLVAKYAPQGPICT